jgi:RNA polymerase sigma factor (sigma-70 family)
MAMNEPNPIKELLLYQGEFMAYLMAILRDFDAAEEVFQNAAVVIVEGATAGEPIRNFRAWAKEIIRRQALYRMRQEAQQARRFRPVTPELFEAITVAFLEEDEEERCEVRALRQCLDKLPPHQRELLVLRYERKQSFEQIGQTRGASPGAIQRSLSRIRLALHDCVLETLKTLQERS